MEPYSAACYIAGLGTADAATDGEPEKVVTPKYQEIKAYDLSGWPDDAAPLV
jgi:hypothetical protein